MSIRPASSGSTPTTPTRACCPSCVTGPLVERWTAVACVANLTPVARHGYRVGLPAPGRWRELLNTDALEWGGSGVGNYGAVEAEDFPGTASRGRPR